MNDDFLFELVIILAFIAVIYYIYNFYTRTTGQEGFQQKERFILKENQDIYDDFYSEIYDEIMNPDIETNYNMDKVLKTLQPSENHSNMLVLGSKTGSLVNYLHNKGFFAYGVEQSKPMIEYTQTKYENELIIKNANIVNTITYDSFLFSHIFCLHKNIYEYENLDIVLKNCHYWLKRNGYLVLHLVDPTKFNVTPPCGISELHHIGKRITKTIVDFSDFVYKSEYENKDKITIHKETFTDKITKNIRQNEQTLYMNDYESIINKCSQVGFITKGYFTLENGPSKDIHQRIYIFEKI